MPYHIISFAWIFIPKGFVKEMPVEKLDRVTKEIRRSIRQKSMVLNFINFLTGSIQDYINITTKGGYSFYSL